MAPFPWTCPFCNKPTTITDPHCHYRAVPINLDNSTHGDNLGIGLTAISCPNQDCKELTLTIDFGQGEYLEYSGFRLNRPKKFFKLIPESSAKPQPPYIPQPITEDYEESCKIVGLSPKASASLARRCLQGMIRDFWKITGKPTLFQEIDAIEDKVDPDLWKAIDAVRKLGNIGAHMEQDVNLIIDIDPGEAEQLIQLIELLFKEWYVAKHERAERIKGVIEISDEKAKQKNSKKETE